MPESRIRGSKKIKNVKKKKSKRIEKGKIRL